MCDLVNDKHSDFEDISEVSLKKSAAFSGHTLNALDFFCSFVNIV
jgi:hypothetical protein